MRVISAAMRGRSKGDWSTSEHVQRLEIQRVGGVSNSITSVQKDYLAVLVYETD